MVCLFWNEISILLKIPIIKINQGRHCPKFIEKCNLNIQMNHFKFSFQILLMPMWVPHVFRLGGARLVMIAQRINKNSICRRIDLMGLVCKSKWGQVCAFFLYSPRFFSRLNWHWSWCSWYCDVTFKIGITDFFDKIFCYCTASYSS